MNLRKLVKIFYLLFIPLTLSAQSILVKLADAPTLAKGSAVLTTTGSATVDAVFDDVGIENISRILPQSYSDDAGELEQWIVVECPDLINKNDFITFLQNAGVVDAHENRAFSLHYQPNDELYSEQYALQKIQAENAIFIVAQPTFSAKVQVLIDTYHCQARS